MKSVTKKISSRRFKRFFLFFLASSFVWLLNSLTEVYESQLPIQLTYVNVPSHLLLNEENPRELIIEVRSSGFNYVNKMFSSNLYQIDLSNLLKQGEDYLLPRDLLQDMIVSQLPNNFDFVRLNGVSGLKLSLYSRESKKVAVVPNVQMEMAQNHRLQDLVYVPDSIVVSGPKEKIASIKFVQTESKNMTNVSEDIHLELNIKTEDFDKNIELEVKQVTFKARIVKFSERVFELPIVVRNSGDSLLIKTFPSRIKVVCNANVKDLKDITEMDFEAYVDAQEAISNKNHLLQVHLEVMGTKVMEAFLEEDTVEYILKQK